MVGRRIGRGSRAAVAVASTACAVLTVSASTALASTVGVEHQPGGAARDDPLVYRAAAGEANALTVTATEAAVTFSDPGALIEPGPDCTSVSAHEASCTRAHVPALVLGDGDDTATAGGPDPDTPLKITAFGGAGNDTIELGAATVTAAVYGGAGNDRLTTDSPNPAQLSGETGDDVLTGGAGADALSGGGGLDRLSGGAGDDQLGDDDSETPDGTATQVDADVLDGGPGLDGVSYAQRSAPVTVDLAVTAGNGEAGEGDSIQQVEDVTGGRGDDRLSGTSGPGELRGGAGADTIAGRGGADQIEGDGGNDVVDGNGGSDDMNGGAGDDTVRGGPGGDFLTDERGRDAIDGGPGGDEIISLEDFRGHPDETVACGSGADTVDTDERDLLLPDCEWVASGALEIRAYGELRGGRVVFPYRCPRRARGGRCSVAIELRGVDGKLAGRGSVVARAGRRARLVVRLRRRARARLHRDGHLRLAVTFGRTTGRHAIEGHRLRWMIDLERGG